MTVPAPSPAEVARTLADMMSAPWPTTGDESRHWLTRHGIDPDTATERASDRDADRNWDRARMDDWGTADAGWGTFGDEFVGVNWFLWRGSSSEEVIAAARTLVELLTHTHGAPTESFDPAPPGGTWFWRLPVYTVDLYAYHGRPRPDGYPAGEPCLQLHLDRRDRAEAREDYARSHPTPRPDGFAQPVEAPSEEAQPVETQPEDHRPTSKDPAGRHTQ